MAILNWSVAFLGGVILGSLAGLFALPVWGTVAEAMKSRSVESFGLTVFVFALFGTALGYTLWLLVQSAPVAAGGMLGCWYSCKSLLKKQ